MPKKKLTPGQWFVVILTLDFHRYDPGLVEEWQEAHRLSQAADAEVLADWQERHGGDGDVHADAWPDDSADAPLSDSDSVPDAADETDEPTGTGAPSWASPGGRTPVPTREWKKSRGQLIMETILTWILWFFAGVGGLIVLALVVWSFYGLIVGGWKRPVGLIVIVLLLVAGLLQWRRGFKPVVERALKKRLQDAQSEVNKTHVSACQPSARLKVVLERNEAIVFEMRKSPISVVSSTLAVSAILFVLGWFSRALSYSNKTLKDAKGIAVIGALIATAAVLTPFFLGAVLLLKLTGGFEHFLVWFCVFIVLDIFYRILRWYLETIVLTDQRLILIRGVFQRDDQIIPLGRVSAVKADEYEIAEAVAYLRITKYALGRLIVTAQGIDGNIYMGYLPVAVLLSLNYGPAEKDDPVLRELTRLIKLTAMIHGIRFEDIDLAA